MEHVQSLFLYDVAAFCNLYVMLIMRNLGKCFTLSILSVYWEQGWTLQIFQISFLFKILYMTCI